MGVSVTLKYDLGPCNVIGSDVGGVLGQSSSNGSGPW